MGTFVKGLFIVAIMAVIGVIYYKIELIPFAYEGFEKNVNKLQRFDAQLDNAIVQTRFGIMQHYDPIVIAMDGLYLVVDELKESLQAVPNDNIQQKIDNLEAQIIIKEELTEQFKRKNPVLQNALFHFSTIIARIIEQESHLELIESCFEQEYQYQLIDKVNTLFRGMLIYTNLPTAEQLNKLKNLIISIRKEPKTLPKLDLALSYADKILDLQPELNKINKDLFNVPILASLNVLNDAYKQAFHEYLEGSSNYRILLYAMVLLLVILLSWAFYRLSRMLHALHIEVKQRVKAQNELAEINKELELRVADRTKELTVKNRDLNQAMADLKEAQEQLIIQEKMASVGMLTTGIAHEIKNPLNFVNNFSELSIDLLAELNEELDSTKDKLNKETLEIIAEIINDLKTNNAKIKEHGVYADNIVKSMLEHSQISTAQKELTDIVRLIDNNVQIVLGKYQTEDEQLEINIEKNYPDKLAKILVSPQTMGQAISYIMDNAIYAVIEKRKTASAEYSPTISISIAAKENALEIKIRDNGVGITQDKLDKVFEPFYTTKPTGRGNTGLGLSICYDTVVKQHKGQLTVVSNEGEFSEFTIVIPLNTDNGQKSPLS